MAWSCVKGGSAGDGDSERVSGVLVEWEKIAGLDVGDGAQREAKTSDLGDNRNGRGGSVFGDGAGERDGAALGGVLAVALETTEEAL